ncbi:hypothetical protein [Kribbella qitaiheensis]|uniref:hypothetical protein n=1 Tax=Kribbella qitaiheensis TaxID=1544730 RepID=UPI001FE7F77D|nr:hypothetical protein [Kribbella qitaiheensis]
MAAPVRLLRIAPSVYLPALLYGIGQGAIAPVVALSGRDLGASVASAGLVVAAARAGASGRGHSGRGADHADR